MSSPYKLPFLTLILLISFASVNAVLFTSALPDIAVYFGISDETAQFTLSWFLIGYAGGQLIYGPLTSRLGRKRALYTGIILQILASLFCVLSGLIHAYPLLVISRFCLALGSGVGLKMTFTLVNECYEAKIASQKIAYLMLAFAITPGLSVAIGGLSNAYFGWMSCFILGAFYGFILLLLCLKLPKMDTKLEHDAFRLSHLQKAYVAQFSNRSLVVGGLLMGSATSFVYVFAALAPFMAMNILGLSSEQYGFANILPSLGLIIGSLLSAQLIKKYTLHLLIKCGIIIATLGAIIMTFAILISYSVQWSLFLPMGIIYIGLSMILANTSTLAMSHVSDKAHGSAVMNFINMGLATVIVLGLSALNIKMLILPVINLILCVLMVPLYCFLTKK